MVANEPGSSVVAPDVVGRIAFVTGGAGGIGHAVATTLRKGGATVYVADRGSPAAVEAAASIGATFVELDVTSTASVDQAIQQVVAAEGRLDIAVNGAGIRHGAAAEALPDDEWDQVFAVNTDGVFRCCRSEARAMLRNGGGTIVNIASMSGSIVNRPQDQSAYNASKAAVIMMTKSLAAEWAERGVRVNSVSPGYVETAMTAKSRGDPARIAEWLAHTPMQRIASPFEIAGAVMFLASSMSSFVTGHDLVVDGGYTAV